MPTSLTPVTELFAAFDQNREKLQREFFEFLRFQSISAEPQFQKDVRACCDWVVAFLKDAGLSVEIWESHGHPVIYAHWLKAGADKPTVLLYNHYDVQPVDPLPLWESPPFEPTLRGEEVYARGAEDNKGQCFYVISAIRWLLEKHGSLPVNVKLCIEGEEETGSAGLAEMLPQHSKELAADYVYIVDLGLHEAGIPALTLGVRGIVSMTVELRGSGTDLHSGLVGGIVYNPNRALAELIAKLYQADGTVAIPGFYDGVIDLNPQELSTLTFDFDEAGFDKMFAAKPNGGEKKFTPLQRAWIRPTIEINGMGGGYTGEGFKTVIPATALAKISCRLVPNQEPEKVGKLVKAFLEKNVPGGMQIDIHLHPGIGDGIRTAPKSKAVQVTAQALTDIFGKPCQFILSGGSIPIAASLAKTAGAEIVLMGFGLPDDNVHAPNEHFGLDRVRIGFATIASVLERLA